MDRTDSLDVVWRALIALRQDLIPEGGKTYNKQWKEIEVAMDHITAELGFDFWNGNLVCVKPDMEGV